MGVKVTIDRNRISARIATGKALAVYAVAEQALTDCNHFARRDQGTMIQSSETASNLIAGKLVWDTPYAKKVYYTGSPSKDANPNASLRWCDKAKDTYGKEWQAIAQAKFTEGMKK